MCTWRVITCVGAVDDEGFDDVDMPVPASDVERGVPTRVPDVHLQEIVTSAMSNTVNQSFFFLLHSNFFDFLKFFLIFVFFLVYFNANQSYEKEFPTDLFIITNDDLKF